MNWVLTALLCVLLVELALRLPFTAVVRILGRSSNRALHTLRAKSVSDHWKEKAMGAYARTTFLMSLKLASLLVLLLGVAVIAIVGLEQIFKGFQGFIVGWQGLGFSVVVASLYLTVRGKLLHGRV
ncbi:MAG: hypothetical protein AAF637_25940 [Pseudomonadota bacterium]